MTLPNAHAGVKKVFIAELLEIIGTLAIVFGAVSALSAAEVYLESGETATDALGAVTAGGLVTVVGLGLTIVALVLTLVGLQQASKDEPDRMGKAYACAIITLILSVVVGVCQSMHWGISGFFSVLSSLAHMCMIIFTIMGVSEVTQRISRQDVADMGPKILVIAVIAIAASIIASIVGNVIGGIAAVIALVLMLVAYIVFLVFLGRASSALAKG